VRRPWSRAQGGATTLLTAFYEDAAAPRREELLACVRRNVADESIGEIHLFLEEALNAEACSALADPKIRLVDHGRRATFRELFDYANDNLAGRHVAIANADIYFDGSLARLGGYDLSNELLCLSRWNVESDGSAWLFEHPDSQDAWIFEAPIRPFPCDFHLGLPACDNRLAWEAEQAGLAVSNPARSLRAYHLHLSHVRRYGEEQRLPGPTASLPAGFLGPALDLPAASVAFAEEMGYAVARLEAGISSHVNDSRPFTTIPDELCGLQFTQVAAWNASSVEVEFLTSGKLFVLVGNDWDGSRTARDWLACSGFEEKLPLVETAPGVGFEAWSLLGETGDRVVVPTQVMLVGQELVRSR
jgi:hypothetical protein